MYSKIHKNHATKKVRIIMDMIHQHDTVSCPGGRCRQGSSRYDIDWHIQVHAHGPIRIAQGQSHTHRRSGGTCRQSVYWYGNAPESYL